MLDPARMTHEAAKVGSVYLAELPDSKLSAAFRVLMDKRATSAQIAEKLAGEDVELRVSLTAALRRLGLVGIPLITEMRAPNAPPAPIKPVIGIFVKPGTSHQDHLNYAAHADRGMDGVAKMAGLAALLEQTLVDMYRYPLRDKNPFAGIGAMNQSSQLYINALTQLHKMQLESGIIKRQPDELNVNLQTAEAFQTYIGELDNGAKEQMNSFAAAFHNFVEAKHSAGSDTDSAA
jgi:hypothetical protein